MYKTSNNPGTCKQRVKPEKKNVRLKVPPEKNYQSMSIKNKMEEKTDRKGRLKRRSFTTEPRASSPTTH